MTVRKFILNILVSVDQFANTVFGGDPDETITSRAAKAKRHGKGWGICLCGVLDLFEKGHCEKRMEADEGEKIDKP